MWGIEHEEIDRQPSVGKCCGARSNRCGVDDTLTWNGTGPVRVIAKAGDVSLFVSGAWHRRLPSLEGDPGRFFLQVHYARRDIAQRIRTTGRANHLSPDAIARATTSRERTLIGLHAAGFTTADGDGLLVGDHQR